MIQYKRMNNEQLSSLYQFACPIWEECYRGVIPDGQIKLLTNKYFLPENVHSYVLDGYIYEYIYYANQKAGFITYYLTDEYIYLDKIYLLTEYRGKHISSNTFEYLQQEYKLPIRLNVNRGNKLGIRSYHGNGFVIIESPKYDLDNGYVNEDYIMEKPFGNSKCI